MHTCQTLFTRLSWVLLNCTVLELLLCCVVCHLTTSVVDKDFLWSSRRIQSNISYLWTLLSSNCIEWNVLCNWSLRLGWLSPVSLCVVRSFLWSANEVFSTSVLVNITELVLILLIERYLSLKDMVGEIYDAWDFFDFKCHSEDLNPFLVSKWDLCYRLLTLLRIKLKSWSFAFHLYFELELKAKADASCSNYRRSVFQHASIDNEWFEVIIGYRLHIEEELLSASETVSHLLEFQLDHANIKHDEI